MKEILIKNILNEIYSDDIEDAIKKLSQYDFYNILETKINLIYKKLESKELSNIEVIATSFLQTVNTKIKSISDTNDRDFLKYLISDISNHLILKYFNIKGVTLENLEKLQSAFKSISEIEGYDYKDLESHINLSKTISFLRAQGNGTVEQKPVYYDWHLKKSNLDILIGDLKFEKIITTSKEFESLFTATPTKVKFNKSHKDYIFVLFDMLYEQNIIKPKVRNGRFAPLVTNAVDFENNILFEKKSNQINYTIKKNTTKFNKLRSKAEKRINSIR